MKIPPKKPHFFKPILPGFKNGLKIPIVFLKYVKEYEHIKRAILKKAGKKWRVKLNDQRFEAGWGKFTVENDVQLGDMLVFRHEGNMEFERLPGKFSRENGLINKKCGLIIRDERQRSWNLKLYTSTSQVYIGGKWAEFRDANDIKEGDHIKFVVVSNGKRPIWKFHDLRGNASLQPDGKKFKLDAKSVSTQGTTCLKIETSDVTSPKAQVPASTSANDANPHFISIMKPYTISKHFLYIPLAFAKSNGWMNRRCEMILMDEQQRSWSVRLGPVSDQHIGVHGGWQKFREANDVQVGDTYRFELISNEKIPVAYFHPAMKDPPKKPRFFKPIVLGFKDGLTVPIGFFKYLKGNGNRYAMLRRASKKWFVKMNGRRLEEGWEEFVKDHDLQLGDILVFRHEGEMEFEVTVFDSRYYLRGSPSLQPEVKKKNLDAERISDKVTDLRLKTSDVTAPESQVAASTSADTNPHFASTVKSYAIYLPMNFAKSNGLMDKREMILVDEKQRSWPVWLGRMDHHIKRDGHTQFIKANGVQDRTEDRRNKDVSLPSEVFGQVVITLRVLLPWVSSSIPMTSETRAKPHKKSLHCPPASLAVLSPTGQDGGGVSCVWSRSDAVGMASIKSLPSKFIRGVWPSGHYTKGIAALGLEFDSHDQRD
ncbi:hypothetical protein RND71_004759 [Anisodus tanguticus]|uniref:TF-B3 domain-containing protein n=1 Tax=Anisodus tanguticus TaxID=243964 RepID=A0AAE1SQ65_9SOLA|nr:hypothetical protein RND71_004759 [Anisodus tanguticus]